MGRGEGKCLAAARVSVCALPIWEIKECCFAPGWCGIIDRRRDIPVSGFCRVANQNTISFCYLIQFQLNVKGWKN